MAVSKKKDAVTEAMRIKIFGKGKESDYIKTTFKKTVSKVGGTKGKIDFPI